MKKLLFILSLLLPASLAISQGAGTLACNDLVQVSVGDNCDAEITPDMILEGTYADYADYEVRIYDHMPNPINSPGTEPNPIGVGEFVVGVFEIATGNNCWGQIVVLDKQPPTIDCGCPVGGPYTTDCTFSGCFNPDSLYNFPRPTIFDNCIDGLELDSTELTVVEHPTNCGQYLVQRTYTVTDAAGMTASCTTEYLFTGFDMAGLVWPKNFDGLPGNNPMLECSENYPLDPNGNPSPNFTGYVEGWSASCTKIELFYNDQVYTQEDGVVCGKKILREWTLVDDCNGDILKHTQIIRITDSQEPVFDEPNDLVITTKPYECNADLKITDIEHLRDNCDAHPRWWVTSVDGNITGDTNGNGFVDEGETWWVEDLGLGEHVIYYHAVDNCGNETIIDSDGDGNGLDDRDDIYAFVVEVVDLVPPIPACEQHKQVSLTAQGNAKVFAYSFDSGSFDNCNDVYFKVLRVNDDLKYDGGCEDLNGDDSPFTGNQVWYDDDVFFCCEDVGASVMVSLRVFDVDPGAGPIKPSRMRENGDLAGHFNDCWSIVLVENKIPPYIECQDFTVECEESLDPEINTKLYPQVSSVCGYELTYEDQRDLNTCSSKITRKWTATAADKVATCVQVITVEAAEPFNPCSIIFPEHVTVDCKSSNGFDNLGEPQFEVDPCQVVTAQIVREQTIGSEDDACYRIHREWVVIDWCLYEENTGAEDNVDSFDPNAYNVLLCHGGKYVGEEDGYYRYTQVIEVLDDEPPVITVEDQCIASVDCYAQDFELTAHADDICTTDGFKWKYKVVDMDTWEVVQYSYNYIPRPLSGVQGNNTLDKLRNTADASLTIVTSLPVGNYKVEWTVGDGCGNTVTKIQNFTIADKKAPTPVLVDLATAVMSNGMVELRARSFDKGGCENGCLSSYDNCTPKTGLYFTFTPVLPKLHENPSLWETQLEEYGMMFFNPETGDISTFELYFEGKADAWLPGAHTSQRAFWCDFLEESDYSTVLKVYVWDRFAYNGVCDDGNYDYANVEINFNHCDTPSSPLVSGMVSYANSTAPFEGMVMNANNGESQVQALTSASGRFTFNLSSDDYELYGSNDQEYLNGVTTLDIVMIQKHILGNKKITNPYKLLAADVNQSGSLTAADMLVMRKVILGKSDKFTSASWIAVSEDYVFENPYKAEKEFDKAIVRSISVGNENIDNLDFVVIKMGDVSGNSGTLESRSVNTTDLIVDNKVYEEGESVEIPFYAKELKDVLGGQFALNYSGLVFDRIVPGKIELDESNINLLSDRMLVSWNQTNTMDVSDEEPLFTIVAHASQKIQLSEVLSIDEDAISSELYTVGSDIEINAINLEFRNGNSTGIVLHQNNPNPFSAKTVIGFDLPGKADYTLTIYDVTGKVLSTMVNTGEAGYNKVEVSSKDINTTGVLYYRLDCGEYSATRKMVVFK